MDADTGSKVGEGSNYGSLGSSIRGCFNSPQSFSYCDFVTCLIYTELFQETATSMNTFLFNCMFVYYDVDFLIEISVK